MNNELLEVSDWFPETPEKLKDKYFKASASKEMSNFGCASLFVSLAAVFYAFFYGNSSSKWIAAGIVVVSIAIAKVRGMLVRRVINRAETLHFVPGDLLHVFERGSKAAQSWVQKHEQNSTQEEIDVIEDRMTELKSLYYEAARLEKSGHGLSELSLLEPIPAKSEWYAIARKMAVIVARLELFVES